MRITRTIECFVAKKRGIGVSPSGLQGGYGEQDLIVLAAAYCFGLAKNHGFVDGNRRTAFLSVIVFLGLNEMEFSAAEPDAVVMMEALASGGLSEVELTAWIRANIAA